MSAKALANLQQTLKEVSLCGEDYKSQGVHVETKHFCEVSRSTTRSLVFMDGRNVGFIDYIVPFSIFKPCYEWILLEFITATPFEFEGAGWHEDPYPKDNEPMTYSPCFSDMEAAVLFFKTHMA